MSRQPLNVEVVAADRQVWEGPAVNIIARTTEGDIGILPGHEPLMAVLVPCVVRIVTADGRSETLAVDGGFISVAHDKVYVLSREAVMGHEVTMDEAHRELAELSTIIDAGEATDDQVQRYHLLQVQIRAGESTHDRV